jgi:LL-diaminopimelate aminotransferase
VKRVARRIEDFPTQFFASLNARIAALQASGQEVFRLDIGSPDLPPSQPIIDALSRSAAQADRHGYQPHSGPPRLRQAWAEMYRRLYGVELDPSHEIVPLLGSKEGIFHLSQALLDPGDIALIPDPGYITYTSGALFAGAELYYLPLLPENDYFPDLNSVPAGVAERAKILWLNYPNNPTAATASLAFFERAVEFARRNEIFLCHDAAYAQIAFEGYQPPSLLQIPGAKEVSIEFNTLSKSHNMAGWRVGAALGNARALAALFTLKTHADSSHFLPVMEAAIEAMNGDQTWLVERNSIYQKRRDLAVQALQEMGFKVLPPKASFYLWCPVPQGAASLEFATRLLESAGVSLTPGTIFGKQGEGYVRIALTDSTERIEEALHCMAAYLKKVEPVLKGTANAPQVSHLG